MTEEITNLVIEIAELAGRISLSNDLSKNLTLRRENRIRSIHSSLAIEQNRLSMEQVSDIIEGKRVLGPPQDIREVKNAYEAYEMLAQLDPYFVRDLLKAHRIMMSDLVSEAGGFRSKGVGVYAGEQLIHMGTPPQYVPDLIKDLFGWLKRSRLHPLVKSCIFHYEFEFIHPFADGNGRMGRLWHTLILSKWKEFFLWMPIETVIHERQGDYYQSLNASNTDGESTIFVAFMLEIICDSLKNFATVDSNAVEKSVAEKILNLLRKNGKHSAKTLAEEIGVSERQVQRILRSLKNSGAVERMGTNRNGIWIVK
ncbi:MAG: Fic family protein [Clostridiales bacterium]|nr:Fic family protein [Clostridiales bacterium]